MTQEKVMLVRQELRRMMTALDHLETRARDDKYAYSGTKESGAVGRVSLDLSRALTKLRASGY